MISKLHALFADAFEYWRFGTLIATIVAILLALGLLMRAPFIATANLEIGGIKTEHMGQLNFKHFEDAPQLEAYFTHHVFTAENLGSDGSCSAQVKYSPNGPIVGMACRNRTESQARELILSTSKFLLDRHAQFYEFSEKYFRQQLQDIENEIRARERMVKALRTPPTSGLSEASIINNQMTIKKLQESLTMKRLLGDRVRPTQLDEASISVVNRQPGLKVWVVVLLLSLGSGLFVAAFSARLKRIEA